MNYDRLIEDLLSEDMNIRKAALAGLLGLGLAGAPGAHATEPTPIVQKAPEKIDIDKLLDVLQYVESKNDAKAIGDGGKAFGILQIWEGVIKDVNRVYKTNYKHEDAFDPVKARDIAKKYLHYYGYIYSRNEKQAPTYEVLARIWNGGPKGYRKTATDKYWKAVEDRLFKSSYQIAKRS